MLAPSYQISFQCTFIMYLKNQAPMVIGWNRVTLGGVELPWVYPPTHHRSFFAPILCGHGQATQRPDIICILYWSFKSAFQKMAKNWTDCELIPELTSLQCNWKGNQKGKGTYKITHSCTKKILLMTPQNLYCCCYSIDNQVNKLVAREKTLHLKGKSPNTVDIYRYSVGTL